MANDLLPIRVGYRDHDESAGIQCGKRLVSNQCEGKGERTDAQIDLTGDV